MVTLTTIAADKVRGFLEGQASAGLRVGVRGGGCSGFQYALALDEPKAEDRIFDVDGIKIIVDEASLQYVDGSEVDYTESLMGSGFQVNNPNVVASCGCGSSLRIPGEKTSGGAGGAPAWGKKSRAAAQPSSRACRLRAGCRATPRGRATPASGAAATPPQ